jgi:hypothetical protein
MIYCGHDTPHRFIGLALIYRTPAPWKQRFVVGRPPSLIPRQQLSGRSPARLFLVINASELLAGAVLHNKAWGVPE